MRPTPEMVNALWHALGKTVAREAVESGLSTALADVPEPNESEGARMRRRRIAELEAQLGTVTHAWQVAEGKLFRVREALVEHSPSKALVILDGEEV